MINLRRTRYIVYLILFIVLSSCSSRSVETGDNFDALELPDGSVVYLNHNSTIHYDKAFNPRTIEVQGEVFLSVVKSATPFVVKTSLGEITVVGTEFDVKSEVNNLAIEVEDGIVELKTEAHSENIKRGEAAAYTKGEQAIKKFKAEFKFKIWMKDLKEQFKKLGKEIKSNSKEIGRESKKAGKQLKQELKKLKVN
ncbi:MAG TPA: FecR family protein [Cyclobacteriaceae bacterium]|jgi:ferric-dicitrate binding protein FerR (iron transport regulator)|nr:FecR family protein [Cyclobacteriaceae bacterium]